MDRTIKKAKPRVDTDGAWKLVIERYFKEFVEHCWPAIFDHIDWDHAPEFLEQEFRAIVKKGARGKRIVDKLAKVHLKNGKGVCLLHVEVEKGGRKRKIFPLRMYMYDYRIYDTHQENMASLALLVDGDPRWRPSHYDRSFFDTTLVFKYSVFKILDFQDRKKELQHSSNPFAFLTLTQLAAIETHRNQEARLSAKLELTNWLYSMEQWDTAVLLRFLDEILALDEEHSVKYQQQLRKLEEDLNMVFITRTEKEWLRQGVHQGESTLLIMQLKEKFQQIPEPYLQKIQAAKPKLLLAWGKYLLKASTLEEVFKGH